MSYCWCPFDLSAIRPWVCSHELSKQQVYLPCPCQVPETSRGRHGPHARSAWITHWDTPLVAPTIPNSTRQLCATPSQLSKLSPNQEPCLIFLTGGQTMTTGKTRCSRQLTPQIPRSNPQNMKMIESQDTTHLNIRPKLTRPQQNTATTAKNAWFVPVLTTND